MSDNPLADLLDNIDRLTKPIKDPVWQDVLEPRLLEQDRVKVIGRQLGTTSRDGLLIQLRAAFTSSTATPTTPVRGGGMMLGGLNLAAFNLYETIDGRIRAAWKELHQPASKDHAEVVLRRWYIHVRNLAEAGQVPDSFIIRWRGITAAWVRSIEGMFNPPVVKELIGSCPSCEATHAANEDGEQTTALYVHYDDENNPEALCRLCGWNVSDRLGLVNLGRHLGASQDEDTLRDMGVIA